MDLTGWQCHAINHLDPSVACNSTYIRGVVALLWPYSASRQSLSLLLAESDIARRRDGGQARITFRGSCARALARMSPRIGDEIVLKLKGVAFQNRSVQQMIPGPSIDFELEFPSHALLQLQRDRQQPLFLHEASRSPTPPPSDPVISSPVASIPFTPSTVRTRRLEGVEAASQAKSWHSPAFLKRKPYLSLLDSTNDDLLSDLSVEEELYDGQPLKRPRLAATAAPSLPVSDSFGPTSQDLAAGTSAPALSGTSQDQPVSSPTASSSPSPSLRIADGPSETAGNSSKFQAADRKDGPREQQVLSQRPTSGDGDTLQTLPARQFKEAASVVEKDTRLFEPNRSSDFRELELQADPDLSARIASEPFRVNESGKQLHALPSFLPEQPTGRTTSESPEVHSIQRQKSPTRSQRASGNEQVDQNLRENADRDSDKSSNEGGTRQSGSGSGESSPFEAARWKVRPSLLDGDSSNAPSQSSSHPRLSPSLELDDVGIRDSEFIPAPEPIEVLSSPEYQASSPTSVLGDPVLESAQWGPIEDINSVEMASMAALTQPDITTLLSDDDLSFVARSEDAMVAVPLQHADIVAVEQERIASDDSDDAARRTGSHTAIETVHLSSDDSERPQTATGRGSRLLEILNTTLESPVGQEPAMSPSLQPMLESDTQDLGTLNPERYHSFPETLTQWKTPPPGMPIDSASLQNLAEPKTNKTSTAGSKKEEAHDLTFEDRMERDEQPSIPASPSVASGDEPGQIGILHIPGGAPTSNDANESSGGRQSEQRVDGTGREETSQEKTASLHSKGSTIESTASLTGKDSVQQAATAGGNESISPPPASAAKATTIETSTRSDKTTEQQDTNGNRDSDDIDASIAIRRTTRSQTAELRREQSNGKSSRVNLVVTDPSRGLRTPLSYYTPLAALDQHFPSPVDVIALVIGHSTIERADSGPRDYHRSIFITDPSLVASGKKSFVTAQIFRPYKRAIPNIKNDTVMLLRDFRVTTQRHNLILLSTDSSGWASPEDSTAPLASNPPVEVGAEEEHHAEALGQWWREQDATTSRQAVAEELHRHELASKKAASSQALSTRETRKSTKSTAAPQNRVEKGHSESGKGKGHSDDRKDSSSHELRDGTTYSDDPARASGERHALRDGTLYSSRV